MSAAIDSVGRVASDLKATYEEGHLFTPKVFCFNWSLLVGYKWIFALRVIFICMSLISAGLIRGLAQHTVTPVINDMLNEGRAQRNETLRETLDVGDTVDVPFMVVLGISLVCEIIFLYMGVNKKKPGLLTGWLGYAALQIVLGVIFVAWKVIEGTSPSFFIIMVYLVPHCYSMVVIYSIRDSILKGDWPPGTLVPNVVVTQGDSAGGGDGEAGKETAVTVEQPMLQMNQFGPSVTHPQQGYPQQGYPQQGYPQQGYPQQQGMHQYVQGTGFIPSGGYVYAPPPGAQVVAPAQTTAQPGATVQQGGTPDLPPPSYDSSQQPSA